MKLSERFMSLGDHELQDEIAALEQANAMCYEDARRETERADALEERLRVSEADGRLLALRCGNAERERDHWTANEKAIMEEYCSLCASLGEIVAGRRSVEKWARERGKSTVRCLLHDYAIETDRLEALAGGDEE